MMQQSHYQYQPSRSKGIGMAIAVHGVIIAAVLAMPGIKIPDRPFNVVTAYPVEAEKPKPQPLTKPVEPEIDIPRKTENRTSLPLPPTPIDRVDSSKNEYSNLGSGSIVGGTGMDFPIEQFKPIIEPVLVEPKLNRRYARQFQPPYPSGRLRLGEEGAVSVRVLVGSDGRAKDIQLIDTPHQDFWNATRRHALRKWRFSPATKDGVPYESWITLKVQFEING